MPTMTETNHINDNNNSITVHLVVAVIATIAIVTVVRVICYSMYQWQTATRDQ